MKINIEINSINNLDQTLILAYKGSIKKVDIRLKAGGRDVEIVNDQLDKESLFIQSDNP
ncbi:MAG: hypothetical protein RIN55_05070 [Tissierellaceae bacterium]|nr:hypothetical protein [Tissierellaceae bacterium]